MSDNTSQVSTSTTRKRVDKHCTNCNGKKIGGQHWSKHKTSVHKEEDAQFTTCDGTDCQQCHTILERLLNTKGMGKHKQLTCIQCQAVKRSTLMLKGQCKGGCKQQQPSSKTVYNFPIGGNDLLGKRVLPPVSNDSLKKQLEELKDYCNNDQIPDYQDIADDYIDEAHEEVFARPELPAAQRLALSAHVKQAKVSANNVNQALTQQYSCTTTAYEPLIENIVVVQHQGQRDQQAMQELHVLLTTSEQSLAVKAAALVSILPMLTQSIVASYFSQQKAHYPLLCEVITLIQSNIEMLSVEKLVALTYAATIVGGNPWTSLPVMLRNMSIEVRAEVLQRLQSLLA